MFRRNSGDRRTEYSTVLSNDSASTTGVRIGTVGAPRTSAGPAETTGTRLYDLDPMAGRSGIHGYCIPMLRSHIGGLGWRIPGPECLVPGPECSIPALDCLIPAPQRRIPGSDCRIAGPARHVPDQQRRIPDPDRRKPEPVRGIRGPECVCLGGGDREPGAPPSDSGRDMPSTSDRSPSDRST